MSLLCMLDLTGNGIQYLSCYAYKDNSDFQTFVNDTSEVLSWIRTNDTDFYRIEKDFRQRANDPMLLDYAGLSHFSSSETTQVLDFLIVAIVIFAALKVLVKLKRTAAPVEETPTTNVCPFCKSEIAIEATRCPHCTSQLEG